MHHVWSLATAASSALVAQRLQGHHPSLCAAAGAAAETRVRPAAHPCPPVTLCRHKAISVTGNIKDCASTVLGFVLFEATPMLSNVSNVAGVAVSLAGGILYSHSKLQEQTQLDSRARPAPR